MTELGGNDPPSVLLLLLIPNQSQPLIIQDAGDDVEVVLHSRHEFLTDHLEPTVTAHGYDLAVWGRQLGSKGVAEGSTHWSGPPGVNPSAGLVNSEERGGKHLVTTGARG